MQINPSLLKACIASRTHWSLQCMTDAIWIVVFPSTLLNKIWHRRIVKASNDTSLTNSAFITIQGPQIDQYPHQNYKCFSIISSIEASSRFSHFIHNPQRYIFFCVNSPIGFSPLSLQYYLYFSLRQALLLRLYFLIEL